MSHWFVVVVLFAVAFVFAQGGAYSVAFIGIAAALVSLALPQKGRAVTGKVVGRAADGRPIIVKSKAAKIPDTIKVKVKPKWGDSSSYEDFAGTAGDIATLIGKTIYNVVKGDGD